MCERLGNRARDHLPLSHDVRNLIFRITALIDIRMQAKFISRKPCCAWPSFDPPPPFLLAPRIGAVLTMWSAVSSFSATSSPRRMIIACHPIA
ncbi:hypothetical protein Cob_v006187 [Colletotrichum orbiculare MAFF 240422]|uniref:Uncharacterized protein n=1 Tax=Colletotrichum orbiculare (strain 104-T / ATCC 96160 / CBS 514.97 / LARS 414 / MAFF 240422) TaxID=1213857 RepID=A0A484FS22_COLOR|nr:hypothetical protein Cob_v006187 [Colletotrichum orbiculare MAFF 240422]